MRRVSRIPSVAKTDRDLEHALSQPELRERTTVHGQPSDAAGFADDTSTPPIEYHRGKSRRRAVDARGGLARLIERATSRLAEPVLDIDSFADTFTYLSYRNHRERDTLEDRAKP